MATDKKNGVGKQTECVFPFIWDGKTYNACTEDGGSSYVGHPWCAHQVKDRNKDNSIKDRRMKEWAYCGDAERCHRDAEYRNQGKNRRVITI